MSSFVVYDNNGRILRVGECPLEALKNQVGEGEFVLVGEANDATQYVDNGTVVDMPPKPNDYSTFSYSTKIWEYDQGLFDAITRKEKHNMREAKIVEGFTYAGLNFQIDSTSRLNIIGKALEIQLDPSITSITWISNSKDATGVDIEYVFTRGEFITFSKEVAKYYEAIILNKE